jgi:hypothetical protein
LGWVERQYNLNSCGNSLNDSTVLIVDGNTEPPLSDYAWFCRNRTYTTYNDWIKLVALKRSNGFGLYDMHGNLQVYAPWAKPLEVTFDYTLDFGLFYELPLSILLNFL